MARAWIWWLNLKYSLKYIGQRPCTHFFTCLKTISHRRSSSVGHLRISIAGSLRSVLATILAARFWRASRFCLFPSPQQPPTQKYRFSKSNQQGVLPSYTSISHRPLGSVLALDYEFNSPHLARLLTIRLHQPADVTEISKNLKDSRDFCFSKGVAFMTEREESVSHLKHETFSSLQYATDFGTIFIRNPWKELRNGLQRTAPIHRRTTQCNRRECHSGMFNLWLLFPQPRFPNRKKKQWRTG